MRTLLLIPHSRRGRGARRVCPTSQQPFFNVVTIEASATADVPTDTLTVTLFVEEQGPDPAALATRVNARLEEALARAKREPKVEARSGNYQTTPVYDRANQITGWRIRADVVLESRDFKAAAALAGALQPALKLWSMTFSLSRQCTRDGRGGAADRSARQVPGEGPRRREGTGLSRATSSGRSPCATRVRCRRPSRSAAWRCRRWPTAARRRRCRRKAERTPSR